MLLLLDRDWAALEDGYEALTAYQQQVLDLRYGLRPGSPTAMNVGDVAAALGKSARSIESAEQRAITRLCERAAG